MLAAATVLTELALVWLSGHWLGVVVSAATVVSCVDKRFAVVVPALLLAQTLLSYAEDDGYAIDCALLTGANLLDCLDSFSSAPLRLFHGTNSSLEFLLSLQTLAFLAHPRTFSPCTRMHGTARIGPFVERRLRSSNLLEQPLRHPRLDKTRTRILVERRLRSSNLPEQPLRHPRLDKAQTRILVAQWHFLRRRRSPTAASSTRDCARSTSRLRS